MRSDKKTEVNDPDELGRKENVVMFSCSGQEK